MTRFTMDRMADYPRSRRAGFTLLELLLVLGIIVLMTGLAWPALRSSMAKNRLRDSAQQLRVELARARLSAMEHGTPLEFRYRAGEGRFRIALRAVAAEGDMGPTIEQAAAIGSSGSHAGREELDSDSGVTESQLPEGVVFAAPEAWRPETTPSADEDMESDAEDDSLRSEGWSPAIIFLPDGTTTNATLALRNGQGAQVVVQLRGMTGLAKPGEVESYEDTEEGADPSFEPPIKTARDETGFVR